MIMQALSDRFLELCKIKSHHILFVVLAFGFVVETAQAKMLQLPYNQLSDPICIRFDRFFALIHFALQDDMQQEAKLWDTVKAQKTRLMHTQEAGENYLNDQSQAWMSCTSNVLLSCKEMV